jgi:hypothetical protein
MRSSHRLPIAKCGEPQTSPLSKMGALACNLQTMVSNEERREGVRTTLLPVTFPSPSIRQSVGYQPRCR